MHSHLKVQFFSNLTFSSLPGFSSEIWSKFAENVVAISRIKKWLSGNSGSDGNAEMGFEFKINPVCYKNVKGEGMISKISFQMKLRWFYTWFSKESPGGINFQSISWEAEIYKIVAFISNEWLILDGWPLSPYKQ